MQDLEQGSVMSQNQSQTSMLGRSALAKFRQWFWLVVLLAVSMTGCSGESKPRGAVIGAEPKNPEELLRDLKRGVSEPAPELVAAMVQYPIVVYVDGGLQMIETQEQFIAKMPEVFTDSLRQAIENEKLKDPFKNPQRWMIGRGEIWFDGDKIITIHNAPPGTMMRELELSYAVPGPREILRPVKDQELITKFLGALGQEQGGKLRGAVFGLGSSSCSLYQADVNNDGAEEWVLVYVYSGSGSYSGVQAVYRQGRAGLTELPFDEIVVKNLFPDKDMSRFHMDLGAPFLIRSQELTYMAFADGNEQIFYLWTADDGFQEVPGTMVRGGVVE